VKVSQVGQKLVEDAVLLPSTVVLLLLMNTQDDDS
jgi:hypothetical protein